MPIRDIVVLTGAGVSAESGVATFRASDGLWEEHRVEDVATPEALTRVAAECAEDLADDGVVWLLVPKSGRPGHVEPGDVTEVAPTAGLSQTSSVSAAKDWSGIRLVTPKAARSRR